MQYNNYQVGKKYNIKSLIHFWNTKEKTDEITIVRNNYVIFKKITIDPFLLSKVNYCKRSYIKMKIIEEILNNILFKDQHLPFELKKIITSFVGYNDKVYFNSNNHFCDLNKYGAYIPYYKIENKNNK